MVLPDSAQIIMNLTRFNEILSNQEPRGFDRYVLAPFLVFVGVKYKKLPKQVRRMLVAAGVWQFMYGYKDYLKLQEDAKKFITTFKENNYG